MLKIAEYNKITGKKIELKELEKFGYKEGKDMLCCSYSAYGKIYNEQLDNILKVDIKNVIYVIEIDKKTNNIELNITTMESPRSFCYNHEDIISPYIKDLIGAGYVEKVEE